MMHQRLPSTSVSSVSDGGSSISRCRCRASNNITTPTRRSRSMTSSSSLSSSSSSSCTTPTSAPSSQGEEDDVTALSYTLLKSPWTTLVNVKAPATLSEGYVFWVTLSDAGYNNNGIATMGSLLSVTVPPGGVELGETLRVPLLLSDCDEEISTGCHRCQEKNGREQRQYDNSVDVVDDDDDDDNFQRRDDYLSLRSSSTSTPSHRLPPIRKQSGQWKDGLCSCFRFGLFHPHFWNAWLCPQVLLGQLLIRMKMTWLVHRLHNHNNNVSDSPKTTTKRKATKNSSTTTTTTAKFTTTTTTPSSSSSSSVQSTFRIIMLLMILLSCYDVLMAPPLWELWQFDEESGNIYFVSRSFTTTSSVFNDDIEEGRGGHTNYSNEDDNYNIPTEHFGKWHQFLYILLSLPMSIWGILVVVRLRAAIRNRYDIPTGCLGQYEDLICVCCCNCCVLSQMARQTADYDGEEPASCCSPNGLFLPSSSGVENNKKDKNDEGEDAHTTFVTTMTEWCESKEDSRCSSRYSKRRESPSCSRQTQPMIITTTLVV